MASYLVDLGQTTDFRASVVSLSGQSTAVGDIVDLLHANTLTQVWLTATAVSGPLPVLIQTSDATTSGTFTDPTSGLFTTASVGSQQFTIGMASGGIFWANSGLYLSGISSPASKLDGGALLCSGGIVFAAFQRPHRYARLIVTSGNATIGNAILAAGFLAQKKLTGSSGTAGGYSYSPGSGTPSV